MPAMWRATFKRFIVVVYRSLRHAANHINGNKQFNCCAGVYRPTPAVYFYFSEKCCWSAGRPGDERRPPGVQVLVDDAASAAGKSSSSSEAAADAGADRMTREEVFTSRCASNRTDVARAVISTIFDAILIWWLTPHNDYTVAQKNGAGNRTFVSTSVSMTSKL